MAVLIPLDPGPDDVPLLHLQESALEGFLPGGEVRHVEGALSLELHQDEPVVHRERLLG